MAKTISWKIPRREPSSQLKGMIKDYITMRERAERGVYEIGGSSCPCCASLYRGR